MFSSNDSTYNVETKCDVVVDYTDFNFIRKIYHDKRQCKVEPGITLNDLNKKLSQTNCYVPYVLP